ncbi:sugar ABC transporter permease [Eubacteriales bacterium OttesenSCG-928-N14]|nr:sugar ABC transporter permease [Eubacteriales bacterium OttesenSCG-928-N14]
MESNAQGNPSVAIEGRVKKEKPKKKKRRFQLTPYLLLIPIIIFAIGFIYYPFIQTALYSVSKVNARGEIVGEVGAAGFSNFAYLFGRKDFGIALTNSIKLTLMTVPITLIIVVVLALLANNKRKLSPIYETLFTLPMAVSLSAKALIFRVMFHPTVGIVNYALGLDYGWFFSENTALIGIMILLVWMGISFNFLLMLSAFRGIPDQLIESAKIDGAGYFKRLFRIQLPLVSPTIFYVLCTDMVLAMLTSAPIIILTNGGPMYSTTTLIYMMFSSGYGSSSYSLAACISLVAFALTFAAMIVAFRFERKKVHYQ